MTGTPPLAGGAPARLAYLGELGGVSVYIAPEGDAFLALHPDQRWRRIGSAGALVREANSRIASLQRERLLLISVLAAIPLSLACLLVMALGRPLSPPGPSLSLAAAAIGCLLTGALLYLGAWVAWALFGEASPRPQDLAPDPIEAP